jgi:hypothetical protein
MHGAVVMASLNSTFAVEESMRMEGVEPMIVEEDDVMTSDVKTTGVGHSVLDMSCISLLPPAKG